MREFFGFNKIIEYNKHNRFKGKAKYLNWVFGILDLLMIVISFNLAFLIRNYENGQTIFQNFDYLLLMIIMIPVWVVILHISNAAKIPRTSKILIIFFEFVQFTILSLLVMFLLIFALKMEEISRGFVLLFAVFHLLFLFALRISIYKFFKYYRATGHNTRNVLVIADATSELFIERMLSNKEWGFRLMMIVSNSKLLKAKFGDRIKIIPDKGVHHLKNIMTFDIVDEIVYSKRNIIQHEIENLVKASQEIGVVFRLQSDLSPINMTKAQTNIQNMPFLAYTNVPSDYFGVAWKTLSDLAFSIIILIILSPVMLLISLLIKFSSEGPVFFKQVRVGLRGRQFYLYKFRTMVVNAEELKAKLMEQNEMDGPAFKIKNDPRVTRIGRFLRKSGLDELPQFFNVLKGEMSLIGPRPPLPEEVKKYERWQLRRLSVKPGITCTWQIVPNRNSVVFDQWMKLDLAYIDNWSPRLDIELFFKTIKTVFTGSGA
ncbi:MAG: sugar transferase [Bacteroidetes bacterium]|nr:sugar transferase [Bacteroidota bacterium]